MAALSHALRPSDTLVLQGHTHVLCTNTPSFAELPTLSFAEPPGVTQHMIRDTDYYDPSASFPAGSSLSVVTKLKPNSHCTEYKTKDFLQWRVPGTLAQTHEANRVPLSKDAP